MAYTDQWTPLTSYRSAKDDTGFEPRFAHSGTCLTSGTASTTPPTPSTAISYITSGSSTTCTYSTPIKKEPTLSFSGCLQSQKLSQHPSFSSRAESETQRIYQSRRLPNLPPYRNSPETQNTGSTEYSGSFPRKVSDFIRAENLTRTSDLSSARTETSSLDYRNLDSANSAQLGYRTLDPGNPAGGYPGESGGPLLPSEDVEVFFNHLDRVRGNSGLTSSNSGLRSYHSALISSTTSSDVLRAVSSSTLTSSSAKLSDLGHNFRSPLISSSPSAVYSGRGTHHPLSSSTMYQAGLAAPPPSLSTSALSHSSTAGTGAYSPHLPLTQEPSHSSSYLHVSGNPVYVPTTRAMLSMPQYHIGSGTGNQTSSPSNHSGTASMWGMSPEGVMAPHGMGISPQHTSTPTPSRFGFSSSPHASSASGMGIGVGGRSSVDSSGFTAHLSRSAASAGLSPYSVPSYMRSDLSPMSPWNTFNNMALQQGFRQIGPGKLSLVLFV